MLKILQELFSPKHHAFNRPFVCEAGAEDGAGVQPNLWDLFQTFKRGSLHGMSGFAAEVRSIFYKCYHTFGLPEASPLSKQCEKLDLVFEQQVNLLPRSLREQAVMPQPQHGGGEAEGEEAG